MGRNETSIDRAVRLKALWDSRWPAVIVALGGAWILTPDLPTIDDGYIVLHSADVILAGRDAVYDVPALTGVTSPAYLALVLLIEAIGIRGPLALYVASFSGLAVFIYGTLTLAAVMNVSRISGMALPVMALVAGPIPLTLANGLETGWATACITWSVVFIHRKQPYGVAVMAGLLPCLRPELAPIAAILIAAAVPLTWRAARPLAVAALVALPFILWVHADTGAWWPQTMEAKRVFFAESCWPISTRVRFAGQLLSDWLWATLPIAVGLAAVLADRLARMALLVVAFILAAYTWTLPGGIAHNDFRYLTPLLVPWALIGLAMILRVTGRAGVIAAVTVIGVGVFFVTPLLRKDDAYARDLRDSARWVEANVGQGDTVLVHNAGAISVFAHRRVVDVVGLKTPSSVATHAATTWPSCGARRGIAINAIAERSGARVLVVSEEWERFFGVADSLRQTGWQLSLARTHPPGTRGFDVYRIQRTPSAPVVDE
jgi:hypothetical protein